MFLFISLHLIGSTVATELIKTLRQITSSLIVNNDFQGESLNASSRAPQSVQIPAASTAAAPAVAVPPQHVSPAVLPPQPAVVPAQKMEPPRQEEVTPATIVRDFGSSALRETAVRHASLLLFYFVVSMRAARSCSMLRMRRMTPLARLRNARARLQQAGEDFWGELFQALQNLLFRPEPELRPATSEVFLPKCVLSYEQPLDFCNWTCRLTLESFTRHSFNAQTNALLV
jgi:hypothetical protein